MVPPFNNPDEETLAEIYAPGEASDPDEIAHAVVFAACQRPASTVNEMNVYMRDWYETYFESGYFGDSE